MTSPMATDVTLPAAAAAGLLSFLSPCVLPLVPPYLTFIAGTTVEEIANTREGRARRDVALAPRARPLKPGTGRNAIHRDADRRHAPRDHGRKLTWD